MAGKETLTSGLLLGRSEVLRNLRHYLREQSQGHHTIDCLEEKGIEEKGNNGGKSERQSGVLKGFTEYSYTMLNQTEPNSSNGVTYLRMCCDEMAFPFDKEDKDAG